MTPPVADHEFEPIVVCEVELTERMPTIPSRGDDGTRHTRARLVVRLHSKTVGVVDVDFDGDHLSPSVYVRTVWAKLEQQINDHMRADGLAAVASLDEDGLAPVEDPPCTRARRALLRSPPPASVIICTRNRATLLARTLESLSTVDYSGHEVLVVDGSSSTDTRDLIESRFPDIRYLSVGDHGRSFALNRGVEAARGAVLAFTDDDVIIDRHWLAELVSCLGSDELACVTGIAFPLELRTRAQLWFEESGGFTDGYRPRSISLSDSVESRRLLPFATGKIGAGVNMAWRRDVLLEIGGFDLALDTLTPLWPPHAGHGSSGEDLAAFFDVLVRGYRLAFDPSAIVFHEHRTSYEELRRQIYWHGMGLSGYLFRSLLRHPDQVPRFLARVPQGLTYGFGSSSVRNHQKSEDFPVGLTRAEWRGVAEGPFAYLRGLSRARRLQSPLISQRP